VISEHPQSKNGRALGDPWRDRDCRITVNYVGYRVMGAVDVVVVQIHRNERGYPENQRTTMIPAGWWEGDTVGGFYSKPS